MPRGGARVGAGRPKGQGKYKEATTPMRIPRTLVTHVLRYIENNGYRIPLYSSRVQAGFPSPADDYIESSLDLNAHLVTHPAATFFVRVEGYSMINAGIHPDDILIVDKSIQPQDGRIVIAVVDGQLTVKRLRKTKKGVFLSSENDDFPPITIQQEQQMIIWGVVTTVIHKV